MWFRLYTVLFDDCGAEKSELKHTQRLVRRPIEPLYNIMGNNFLLPFPGVCPCLGLADSDDSGDAWPRTRPECRHRRLLLRCAFAVLPSIIHSSCVFVRNSCV